MVNAYKNGFFDDPSKLYIGFLPGNDIDLFVWNPVDLLKGSNTNKYSTKHKERPEYGLEI